MPELARTHNVEIFAIGDELLFGRIYDTNSFWLAERLSSLGGAVQRITCLPDREDTITAELRVALQRGAGVIVTTGGLGPTVDDRTLDAVAAITGARVVVDQATLQAFARRRNVDLAQLSPALHKMASVVDGSQVWQNPVGWAPGVEVTLGAQRIVCLPGPPREVQGLFDTHIAGRLADLFGRKTRAMRVRSHLHESDVSPLLQEVMREQPDTYLKALVSFSDAQWLPIDIVAHGESPAAASDRLLAAVEALRTRVAAMGSTLDIVEVAEPGDGSNKAG